MTLSVPNQDWLPCTDSLLHSDPVTYGLDGLLEVALVHEDRRCHELQGRAVAGRRIAEPRLECLDHDIAGARGRQILCHETHSLERWWRTVRYLLEGRRCKQEGSREGRGRGRGMMNGHKFFRVRYITRVYVANTVQHYHEGTP